MQKIVDSQTKNKYHNSTSSKLGQTQGKQMSRFKSEEFKKLQQEWYQKLLDSGYEDLELFTNQMGVICHHSYTNSDVKNLYGVRKRMDDAQWADHISTSYLTHLAFRAYLAFCTQNLPFLDRKLLELRSEGHTENRIVTYLEKFICRYPRIKSARTGKLVSTFGRTWVKRRLKDLHTDVNVWNHTHPEGIRFEDYEEEDIMNENSPGEL